MQKIPGNNHNKNNSEVIKLPRKARIKSSISTYHIIVRSIARTPLYFEDKDKDYFLNLIKEYQKEFGFRVYGYCLMTTHGHLIISANGADISKIMKSINQSYAQYFNRKYDRHGHVFWDRFKSLIVKDDRQLITLSAYVHNNPKDMKKYKQCVERYKYSSLGFYLGIRGDSFGILDKDFVMDLFSEDTDKARKLYLQLVYASNDKSFQDTVEFKDEKSQYRSEKVILVRNFSPEDIMDFVAKYTGVDRKLLKAKYNKNATEARALCVYLMRYLCDYTQRQICAVIGYITLSRISSLCHLGLKIIEDNEKYRNILKDFIKEKAA